MDNSQFLNEIQHQVEVGALTREEVLGLFSEESSVTDSDIKKSLGNIKMSQILSYVGAFIVFIGIVILIIQHWNDIGLVGRILVTLGAGVVAYIMGAMFGYYEKLYQVSQAFYLLSGFLLPVGLAVVFEEYSVFEPLLMQVVISGALLMLYGLTLFIANRKDIFIIFSILYGTWFIYAFAIYIFEFVDEDVFKYLTLIVGVAYMLLGYWISSTRWNRLASWLYSFGVIGLLTAAISLGGVWDFLFAGILLGVMYLSIYLASRSFLVFGTLFIMIYIGKLTAEYFANVTGWPVALVIAGLALIGAGYLGYYLNEKYFPKLS